MSQRSHGRLRSATVAMAIAVASGSGAYGNWRWSYTFRGRPEQISASTGFTRRKASGRHCTVTRNMASHAGCSWDW